MNFVPGGQKVYFPRFVLTLLRPEKHVPHQVIFKCSTVLNKFDLHQYLSGVYGLRVLDIRTVTFPMKQRRTGTMITRSPAWKKVYVTLDHDFPFPKYTPPPAAASWLAAHQAAKEGKPTGLTP
jgi:ribosomal protein L23